MISDEIVVVSDSEEFMKTKMIDDSSRFGVLTDNETPRKVFILENRKIVLRDEHSGLKVSTIVKFETTFKV